MANDALGDHLEELAALLRVAKADRFRLRAYAGAARVVRAVPVDLATMSAAEIGRLEGIGAALGRLIDEFQTTGTTRMLEGLREGEPAGFGALLRLPLIGVRDARALAGTHGFDSIAALQAAADTPGGLDPLGEKLAPRVRESLRRLTHRVDHRVPLPLARRDAQKIAGALAAVEGVDRVELAGSARRACDTVGTFAFVLVGGDPDAVLEAATASRPVVRVIAEHERAATVLTTTGRPAALVAADEAGAGTALVMATGSEAHLGALRRIAAGDLPSAATEAELYAALGLAEIPPELREDTGEIEAAAQDRLPALLAVDDLRGDLHVHTDYSGDGKQTLEGMVVAAKTRGYDYVALTDHTENLKINGMPRELVLARRAVIAEVQQRHPEIRLLDGAELNIGLEGDIDYDLEFLLQFDIGVASIHSHMDRLTPVQTDRILTAIAHPAVHVIGHPTGRILGHRPAYGIEITAIAQAAAETGTALEVNGSPRRLDLSGEMVRIAVGAGAAIAVSSDAHSIPELDYVHNAVPTARRGWAEPVDVINCRSLDGLLGFVQRKKERAS